MHRSARTGTIQCRHKSTCWAVLCARLAAPAAPRREKSCAAVRSHRARVGSACAGGYHTSFASRVKHCHPEPFASPSRSLPLSAAKGSGLRLTQGKLHEGSECWWMSHLPCQSDTHELPLGVGRKEVAVSGPYMRKRGRAGAAAQDVLVAHEFPIVFPDRPRSW